VDDVTPEGIHDLAASVQEWTRDAWREDRPGKDESWVAEGGIVYRAVRGTPLERESGTAARDVAFRQPLCTGRPCPPAAAERRRWIGFRCVR
jgi:hypothetical protein